MGAIQPMDYMAQIHYLALSPIKTVCEALASAVAEVLMDAEVLTNDRKTYQVA